MAEQSELNRLFWQSRRGMLELDVLLVPFVKEVYPGLDEEAPRRYRKPHGSHDPRSCPAQVIRLSSATGGRPVCCWRSI